MVLFAEGVDPHTLGGSALAGTFILAVGMWWKSFLDNRREMKKMEIESQEKQAKMKADADLALRNSDIQAATAKLTTKVEVLEAESKRCAEDGAKKDKALAECQEKHARGETRMDALEKTVEKLIPKS